MDRELLVTLQIMAWERAKGEFRSILSTIYPDYNQANPSEEYDSLKKLFDEFIEKVENETSLQ